MYVTQSGDDTTQETSSYINLEHIVPGTFQSDSPTFKTITFLLWEDLTPTEHFITRGGTGVHFLAMSVMVESRVSIAISLCCEMLELKHFFTID